MAAVSRFSTPETFAQAEQGRAQIIEGIKEAQLAVQAGVPGAQQALATAEAALKQVDTFMSVYFPQGKPPSGG